MLINSQDLGVCKVGHVKRLLREVKILKGLSKHCIGLSHHHRSLKHLILHPSYPPTPSPLPRPLPQPSKATPPASGGPPLKQSSDTSPTTRHCPSPQVPFHPSGHRPARASTGDLPSKLEASFNELSGSSNLPPPRTPSPCNRIFPSFVPNPPHSSPNLSSPPPLQLSPPPLLSPPLPPSLPLPPLIDITLSSLFLNLQPSTTTATPLHLSQAPSDHTHLRFPPAFCKSQQTTD